LPHNLTSPNGLIEPCEINNLTVWYENEVTQVGNDSVQIVLREVGRNLEAFVRWPKRAVLLWKGCDRIPQTGKRQRYHKYPDSIRAMARAESVYLDARPNGPAIAAFCLAGGERPSRFGSSNAWSIHHAYSGKFPYLNRTQTTHAAKLCNHFTQSAGLVAVHPIADGLADEFPFFAWLLRAKGFIQFRYDPDGVFSDTQDELGFSGDPGCEVIEVVEP
jgi:hypothetical protein